MRDKHLLAALTSLRLKKEGKGALKSPQFAEAMAEKLSDRIAGAAYLRSGWAPAIEALGGKFRGDASTRGILGYAEKATGGTLRATIVHITEQPNSRKQASAEKIADAALQKAADKQVEDMEKYISRKLSEVFD
jgi:hypothetical protein